MLLAEVFPAKRESGPGKAWETEQGNQKMGPLVRNSKILWMSVVGFFSLLYILVCISKFLPNSSVPIFPPPELESFSVCGVRMRVPEAKDSGPKKPTLFFITPTYSRREQVAELTRLSQTLLHLASVHWVVGEDSSQCSPLVSGLLQGSRLPFTHLASPQPELYRAAKLPYSPRGVSSRRAGLAWVLQHRQPQGEGVVYFGDDDNTYSVRLLEELGSTAKVSMFPVGLVGEQGVSTPLVSPATGKVIGFSDSWFAGRKFPVDMAGFAVNLRFLVERNPLAAQAMPYKAGYEEDMFLQSLSLSLEDISPLASNCTEVLVWHTKTTREKLPSIRAAGNADQASSLLKHMERTGMAQISKSGKKVKTCYDLNRCLT